MIVQNKGGKGNPNHDEEGKFTSAGGVGSKNTVENSKGFERKISPEKLKELFGDIFGETEEIAKQKIAEIEENNPSVKDLLGTNEE